MEKSKRTMERLCFLLPVFSTIAAWLPSMGWWWMRDDYAHLQRLNGSWLTWFEGWDFHRPLFDLLLAGATSLGGGLPLMARLVTLATQVALVILVMRVARRWQADPASACLAGLLVALHPATYETSVWICAFSGPLAECFGLLALLAFWRHDKLGRWQGLGWLVAAALSKESAIVYLLLGWLVIWRTPFSNRRERVGWLASVSALLVGMGVYAALASQSSSLHEQGSIRLDMAAMGELGLDYLSALVWPGILPGVFWPPFDLALEIPPWIGGMVVLAIADMALWKRRPSAWLLTIWMVAAVMPYTFFPWGPISRYVLSPLVPFALLVALSLQDAADRMPRRAKALGMAVLVLLLLTFGLSGRMASPAVLGWNIEGEVSRVIEQGVRHQCPNGVASLHIENLPMQLGWGDTVKQAKQIAQVACPTQRPIVTTTPGRVEDHPAQAVLCMWSDRGFSCTSGQMAGRKP